MTKQQRLGSRRASKSRQLPSLASLGGHVHLDGALLVDTVDMLYALSDRGAISPAKCYEKLRVARESGFRFIPHEDELLAAVAEAPISNHELLKHSVLNNCA